MRVRGFLMLAGAAAAASGQCLAQPFQAVYGGPTYDVATLNGFRDPALRTGPGFTAGSGVGVVSASAYSDGTNNGLRAFRWNAAGAAELDNLGTDGNGVTTCDVQAVNATGSAVGRAMKYTLGQAVGEFAVRWDAGSTAVTELDNLVVPSGVFVYSRAYAVNAAGTAVGLGRDPATFRLLAARWNAGGTAITLLDNMDADPNRIVDSSAAYAVNAGGTAVGYWELSTVNPSNRGIGYRAVRWDAGGTAATELDNLGTDSTGYTQSIAFAINSAGTAVGYALQNGMTTRIAVRWDAGGSAVTQLGGPSASVIAGDGFATAINDAGTVVGTVRLSVNGMDLGNRGVRWAAGGTTAAELGNLGTRTDGGSACFAYAISADGTAVGTASKYDSGGNYLGPRAVAWRSDGVAIDLNTFIDPAGGWFLTSAVAISDTNWVTGIGTYDPDGAGPTAAYDRAFLLQIPMGTGACCRGTTCSVVTAGACTGVNSHYSGDSTVCNASGNATTPCCKADFNHSGVISAQDIFDFLGAWFGADASADFNGGGLSTQDIFDFLAAWFAGC